MIKGQGFTVQFTRGKRVLPDMAYPAGYASKAGDARRQGRVEAPRGAGAVAIEFKESGSQIEARLGVVTVGSVTSDPNGGRYFWAVFLPGISRVPRAAGDADKARNAIAHKVREWCEAAKLISVRRG